MSGSEEKVHSDLEGLDLTQLDLLRAQLMGDRNSFDLLSEDEIERWLAINNKMRLVGRVASKPPADGGRKRKSKDPEQSIDTLLGLMK